MVEFRTPQHPSLGTNNWGGASPLLARNIPKESLDQRYLKLNSIRTRDEIFPVFMEEITWVPEPRVEKKAHTTRPRLAIAMRGLLPKFALKRTEKKAELGSGSRKRWFPVLDPQNRWPQGWC